MFISVVKLKEKFERGGSNCFENLNFVLSIPQLCA
jgi:hypothetical protein